MANSTHTPKTDISASQAETRPPQAEGRTSQTEGRASQAECRTSQTEVRAPQAECRASRYCDVPRREMHFLRRPHGFVSGIAWGNLGYQMAYSVKVLEGELAEEGRCYVLQLLLAPEACQLSEGAMHGGLNSSSLHGKQNPSSWKLYANGVEVASGTGEFARECFYESATAFMDVCRDAVESAEAEGPTLSLSPRECEILKAAQRIAAVEAVKHHGALTSKQALNDA